ncbi:putative peptide zinc metalloprotease protein [uncultured Gammaproteobacteria bacterium]
MGIALLVLWPVLYTDVSDAWRLVPRRQRLLIGAAGVLAELALALIATFVWSFLSDGPARSAAFLVATTTWIATLAINFSPFMRFDGYYLLSDWLGVSNLGDRSFALGRWRLRQAALGLDEAPPEVFPPHTRRILLIYAWTTWLYRAVVFFGIALLVYHFFIKLVGIFLMAVEIVWFLARPVLSEAGEWWQRRHLIRLNRNLLATLALLTVGVGALVTPWQGRVALPAVMRAAGYATLFPPLPARIVEMTAAPDKKVTAGEVLYRLEAPELDYGLRAVRLRIAVTDLRLQRATGSAEVLESLSSLQQQLATLISTEAGLIARQERLVLRAPFDGVITDLPPDLRPGLWLKPDQPLGRVVNRERATVRGYLAAADLERIRPGARGRFIPEDPVRPGFEVKVIAIEQVNAAVLDLPMLASTQGGPIAVQPAPAPSAQQGALVPTSAVYRVTLTLVDLTTQAPEQIIPGTALIEAGTISPLARLWRFAASVFIRESGW